MKYAWGRGGVSDGASATVSIDADQAHSGHIVIPDAQFLFTAEFRRARPDLVLSGHDGRQLLIPDYFAGEHRPTLAAANGASLPPDLIDLLVGSPTPGHYAQAQ